MTNSAQDSRKDTTVRVPWDLLEQVKQIAKAHDRSLAAEVRVALTEYVRKSAPDVEAGGASRYLKTAADVFTPDELANLRKRAREDPLSVLDDDEDTEGGG